MSVGEQHEFLGIHVFGEIYGVDRLALDNARLLENSLKSGIRSSGATLCHMQTQKFEPNGVTILALLSESHASIHTYPEKGALFFDAFTCGTVCQPQKIAQALIDMLSPKHHNIKQIERGMDSLHRTNNISHLFVPQSSSEQ